MKNHYKLLNKLFLLSAILLFSAGQVSALGLTTGNYSATITDATGAYGANNGTSWTDAYTDLPTAKTEGFRYVPSTGLHTFTDLNMTGTVTLNSSSRDVDKVVISSGIYGWGDAFDDFVFAPALDASVSYKMDVSCYGGSNGAVVVSASGGVAPYSYSWSPSGGTGATATGLTAGSYTCTVTDADGIFTSVQVTINQPPNLTTTTSQTNVSTYGGSDGTATVIVTGGTPSYTYSWAPSGGMGATASGLTTGSYNCTVTDENGCYIQSANILITQPAPPPVIAPDVNGIIYVTQTGAGNKSGNSWANATNDFQSAVNATGVKQVWVAEGTYRPVSGQSFSMKSGVKIYGGFAGTETSLSQRNWATNVTLLKGNGNSVISSNGLDTSAVLDGFTITGGKALGQNGGGGIYNQYSFPKLINLTITGNSAPIYVPGGGVANYRSSPVLTNVIIKGNIAGADGGGMVNYYSYPVLTNVTIGGNISPGGSDGGINNYLSSPIIRNSIIYGNSGIDGIVNDQTSTPVISYSLVQGLTDTANGNIASMNPQFVDTANGNYNLLNNSPVINKGNNAYFSADSLPDLHLITTDIAGNPRIQKGIVDMGVYESPYMPLSPDANGIVYVTQTGAGNNSGDSWANATNDLQMAMDANSVKQVWVAGGTYKPIYPADSLNTVDSTNRNNAFVLKKDVKVYGGFAGTETALSQRNLTQTANASILSGDIGIVNDSMDNAYHVVISAGDVGTAELNGFTITGGNGNVSGSITVNAESFFRTSGGGITSSSSSPVLTNVTISGNSTTQNGGGIFNFESSPVLTNVTISGNSTQNGGGIFNLESSPVLTNVTISGNKATNGGGGMSNIASCFPVLTNVTISGNTGKNRGGGVENESSSVPIIRNSIIYGNNSGIGTVGTSAPVISYSLVQGLTSTDNGNIASTDPQFVDAANGDYHLQATSPVINKGSNAYYSPDSIPDLHFITTDLASNARIVGGTVDMGAYESPYVTLAPDANGIIYVTPVGAGNNTGNSWANATNDLQMAMDATGAKQVWVAGGTYKPIYPADSLNTVDSTNRDDAFVLQKGVKVYGGFAGTETALSQRNLTQTANASILSGDIGIVNDSTDNAYHVVISAGDVDSAELNGFTITDGNANGRADRFITINGGRSNGLVGNPIIININRINDDEGGAIYNSNSSPKMSNLLITGNSAHYGGGILSDASSPLLNNVVLVNNHAAFYGGGMYNVSTSSPEIINTNILNNTASVLGGGMANMDASRLVLTNVTISGNSAKGGGGIYNYTKSTPVLTDVTISGNTGTGGYGGGMNLVGGGTATITNSYFYNNTSFDGTVNGSGGGLQVQDSATVNLTDCVFANNRALGTQDDGGGAIILYDKATANCSGVTFYNNTTTSTIKPDANTISTMAGSTLSMNNSIIWGNGVQQIYNLGTTTITYSDVQGSYAGTGNISKYPQFKDTTHNNFSLKIVSPVINAGSNQLFPVPNGGLNSDSDIAGNPRVYHYSTGGIIDMGAYEFQGNPIDYSNIGFADSSVGYNGEDQQYKAAHIPDSIATVTYTVRDSDNQVVTEAMALGKYTIEAAFKIADGTVGLDTTVTLIIKKGTITGVTFNNSTVTYDGSSHTLAISGVLPAGASVSYSSPMTEAGTYTDTAYLAGGNNYNNDTLTARLIIEKAGTTGFTGVTFTSAAVTYNGNSQSLAISGTLPAGASVSYSSPKTDAGTYTDTAYITGGNNYENDTLTAQLTIGKAAITGITLSDSTVTYDDNSHYLVISGTLPAGTTVSYSSPATSAGIYTDTVYLAGGNNYENDTLTAQLTITKPVPPHAIYVKGNATGSNNGSSWANAYTNFQTAINAASAGDSVFVAAGTYQPASGQSFSMKEGVKIYGGFAGTETSFSQRNWATNVTILKGNNNSVINNNNNGLDTTAVLDGFTITGGVGGGGNYGGNGGGIYNNASSPAIINCIFSNNKANFFGGGIYNNASSSVIINSIFSNNAVGEGGGGIFNGSSTSAIINCTFFGNKAKYDGGGAVLNMESQPAITNSIFYDNSDNINFHNSGEIWDTFASASNVTYSLVQGGYPGIGNISADPLFVGTATGNFSLQSGSPAINKGNSAALPSSITTDIADSPRIVGGTIDMGAYEFQESPIDYSNIGFADSTVGYNGEDQQYKAANIPDGIATVTYTVRDSDNQVVTEAMESGKYTIEAAFKMPDETVGLDTTVTLIIKKATITGITFSNATVTYDGNTHSLAISGTLAAGASVSYSSPKTEPGINTDTAYISGGNNYNNDTLTARLTIEKASITGFTGITFNNATVTYDGNNHSLAISGALPAGASVSYSSPKTEAGIYTDTAYMTGGNNYENDTLTARLTIGKATITGVIFKNVTVTYDGSNHSVAADENTLPKGVTISGYDNNDQTNAGTYTVTAHLSGGNNYNDKDITATLTINKASQTIIFSAIPNKSLEASTDFQLQAIASSGLPVTYSYSYTAPAPPATVTPDGFVKLLTSGLVTITASQAGNNNYLPATEVEQTLQINSDNASIFNIQVGDTAESDPSDSIYYQIDCHNSTESVSVTITADANAVVTPGRTFAIQTPKPGIYTQQVTVTSPDGSTTKDYTIIVNKAFSFRDIVVQKFNNVLLVNNNPATNGGYQFVGYKWYKNGVLVGTGPYYSAGNEINDQLDNTAVYSVVLTTANGEVLHTCGGVITLTTLFDATLSPNPASPGGTITLTVTLPPSELAQMRISIYSPTGNLIKIVRSSDEMTQISLPASMIPGTYIVKCETPDFQKSFKLIVQ